MSTAAVSSSTSLRSAGQVSARGHIGLVVLGAIASGLLSGLLLVLVVLAGGPEHEIIGAALVALGIGFVVLAVGSSRSTDQPQPWALRPGEWVALEWRDVDLQARVLYVRRAYRNGNVKCTKTEASVRAVPLQAAAVDALAHVPIGPPTDLVFPAVRGGPFDLHKFRRRAWLDVPPLTCRSLGCPWPGGGRCGRRCL